MVLFMIKMGTQLKEEKVLLNHIYPDQNLTKRKCLNLISPHQGNHWNNYKESFNTYKILKIKKHYYAVSRI